METQDKDLITRDFLAIIRTKLANERTFLAYFRSAIIFLASGYSFYKIEVLHDMKYFGLVFIAISPVILITGVIRSITTHRKIKKYYK